jgi:hypothetical protein
MVMFFSFSSFAQNAQGAKNGDNSGVEKRVEKMVTDLGLNESETAAVKTLFAKQGDDMNKFRTENTDKESADYKTKQKVFRTAQEAEMKAVLGEAKFAKYMEIRESERKSRPQKPE